MNPDSLEQPPEQLDFYLGSPRRTGSAIHPQQLTWRQIQDALDDLAAFAEYVLGDPDVKMSRRQIVALRERWSAAYDLPSGSDLRRLAAILTRYGRAVEFDFLGKLDVPTVWRQRRFKFLLGMIEQLPSHSRYAEALAQDDELAEELFDVEQDGESQGPPVSSWTPEVALLTLVAERLGIVGQFTAAAARHRYTPPDLPRPTTAHRRVWLRRNLSGHRMRVARMLPPVDDREETAP